MKLENRLWAEIQKLHEWNKTVPEDEKINIQGLIEDIAETPEVYPDFGEEFNNQVIEDKMDQLHKALIPCLAKINTLS